MPWLHRAGLRSIQAAAVSALMALVPAAPAAFAQDLSPPGTRAPGQVPSNQVAQAEDPPCFCWADGRKIAEGRIACIRTANGRHLAECGRVINMMSWRISDEICPES